MCLAIPLIIKEINGQKAVAQSGNHLHEVDLSLVKDVKVGDYILAHGEMAINKIPQEEAERILGFIGQTQQHEH